MKEKFYITTFSFLLVLFFCSAVGTGRHFNSFNTPLTQADKQNISYIINTLSGGSVFQLMFKKKSLENAGERVNRVHPLRFLSYVFSDPTLSAKFREISGVPRTRFINDMAVSLAEAASSGQMGQEVIKSFAEEIHGNLASLEQLAKEGRWKQFIETASQPVP